MRMNCFQAPCNRPMELSKYQDLNLELHIAPDGWNTQIINKDTGIKIANVSELHISVTGKGRTQLSMTFEGWSDNVYSFYDGHFVNVTRPPSFKTRLLTFLGVRTNVERVEETVKYVAG